MLGNSWQPPESHNLPLFHRKAGCVSWHCAPSGLESLALCSYAFLVLGHSSSSPTRCQKPCKSTTLHEAQSLPSGFQSPLAFGTCHLSHLCPPLPTSAPPSGPVPAKTPLLSPLQVSKLTLKAHYRRVPRMCVFLSLWGESDSPSLASLGLPEPSVISLFIVRVRWLWPPRCWVWLGELVLSPAWESWDFPKQPCVPLTVSMSWTEAPTPGRPLPHTHPAGCAAPALLCHVCPSVHHF